MHKAQGDERKGFKFSNGNILYQFMLFWASKTLFNAETRNVIGKFSNGKIKNNVIYLNFREWEEMKKFGRFFFPKKKLKNFSCSGYINVFLKSFLSQYENVVDCIQVVDLYTVVGRYSGLYTGCGKQIKNSLNWKMTESCCNKIDCIILCIIIWITYITPSLSAP